MKTSLRPLLIAAVAFATVAAAQGAGLLERYEDARRHYQKAFAAPADLPEDGLGHTRCVDGMAGPFPCQGVDLLSFIPLSHFTGDTTREVRGGGASDVWGWVDPETGDEYALVGKTHGTAFFRITDPTNPQYVGELPSGAAAHLRWYDIKVYEDHAFIVSESIPHGMQIFDLTRLRQVGADDEPQQFDADALYPASGIHNLAINEDTGFAYIVGGNAGLVVPDQCRSGLHMVDIRDPKRPLFAGCHLTEGGPGTAGGIVGAPPSSTAAYVHDTLCVTYDGPDDEHDGREICFNSSETHVSIVDVSDKRLPKVLGTYEYDGVAYTHQGWLTEDQRYFVFGDEGDEDDHGHNTRTYILDVSDLDAPKAAGDGFHEHETAAIDHNMFVKGQLLYQSNYRAGFRVLDLANVGEGELDEVAFFDVYPEDDAAEFDGTWGNWPYFPSGTIAVSGYQGLWLVELQPELAHRYYPPGEGAGA